MITPSALDIPDELVEKVARALCITQEHNPDRLVSTDMKTKKPIFNWQTYEEEARAAIACVLEWVGDNPTSP